MHASDAAAATPSLPIRAVRGVRGRVRRWRGARAHRREVGRGAGRAPDPARRPVFIIGAPRSGSTLLYQVLTECFDVGYLSNAHCAHHWDPSRFERAHRPLAARGESRFASTHGATREAWEPSECGDYWYRFVARRPHRITPDDVDERAVIELRSSVRELIAAFGAPVVYKNLLCSLRLPLIARALPEALFVVIERDEVANARSLLAGRIARFGDAATWWSAEPPSIDALRELPAEQQVLGQVRDLLACVTADAARIGEDRFHHVQYERLCADPRGEVERFAQFAGSHGMMLNERAARSLLPESFPVGGGGRGAIPDDLNARLQREAAR